MSGTTYRVSGNSIGNCFSLTEDGASSSDIGVVRPFLRVREGELK